METTVVSKSQLKPRVLEVLRTVEKLRQEVVVTDRGRPVARIVPYEAPVGDPLEGLRGTVLRYDDPTEPVGGTDWEALK